MRKLIFVIALAAVLLAAAGSFADDQDMATEQQMPTPEQMETYMKLATPGEHHEHMAKLAGSWKFTSKAWMAPGQEPMISEGTAETHPILGGRFIETVYKGTFMGMPFEGRGIDGYDNYAEQHTAYWIDTMGTMHMNFTGDCSDDHKVTTMTGDFVDPATDQKMKAKSVLTMVDDDKYTFEYYMLTPEGELKSMELTATRQ